MFPEAPVAGKNCHIAETEELGAQIKYFSEGNKLVVFVSQHISSNRNKHIIKNRADIGEKKTPPLYMAEFR